MTALLAPLAPALLAGALAQTPPHPGPACLPSQAQVNEFTTRWFCGQLAAAGKGRLDGPTAYRLLHLPSFRPAMIVEVRQERSGWLIQTTILSGAGGGPPGGVRERRQRWLTADDVLDLAATVNRSGVWHADVRVASNVIDDSTVLVEAVQPGMHRVHILGAAAMAGQPLRDLVELFRVMAGIDDLEK
jgi:hypothetical protein